MNNAEMLIRQALGAGAEAYTAIDRVAALRRQIAASILNGGDDEHTLSQTIPEVERLFGSRMPWDPVAEDLRLAERILEKWAASPEPSPGAVLAAMALIPAHNLPSPPRLVQLPVWLRHQYVRFLLMEPVIFLHAGEADRLASHLMCTMARVHEAILYDRLPDSRSLADAVAKAASVMIYFNEQNLHGYFRHRAEIIEWLMVTLGYKLENLQSLTSHAVARVGLLHSETSRTEASCLLALLEGRPKGAMEIILYCCQTNSENLLVKPSQWADQIVRLPEDVNHAVSRIREDDLDLLFVSNNITYGLTSGCAIAAHRLARVQVVGGASPVSPSFSNCDLYLSGELNDPASDAQKYYEERLTLLPGSVGYYAFSHDQDPQTVRCTRARFGIEEDQIVFFSAANYYKILPELLRAWAEILAQEPRAVLMLMPFNPNWGSAYPRSYFRRRLDSELLRFGVLPRRVIVVDVVPTRADLHAVMALADIYLDSFPFSGACSLVDPLQIGLPIVATDGCTLRTTVAAAVLRLQGLDEMICAGAEAYIERAVRLAREPDLRRLERDRVRQSSSPQPRCLLTENYARSFADFCLDAISAWRRRCESLLTSEVQILRGMIVAMAKDARGGSGSAFRRLTDLRIITELVIPYLRMAAPNGRTTGRMIDVGACMGQAALPFLAIGVHAEMYEPDPECAAYLDAICRQYPGMAAHRATAVVPNEVGSVRFCKRSMGLSSLGHSPVGEVQAEFLVPATPVRHLCGDVDFVKVDAEGFDLKIINGIDFEQCRPKLMMVEYSLDFEQQSLPEISRTFARMDKEGYDAIIFENGKLPGFGVTNWDCELMDLSFAPDGPRGRGHNFGNIVFFRKDDTQFLSCFAALLETYLPARRRPAFLQAQRDAAWLLAAPGRERGSARPTATS